MSTPTKTAEVYDFIHPDHKLGARWPVLEQIHKKVEGSIADSLSERLKISVTSAGGRVKPKKVSDSIEATGPAELIYELSLRPLSGVAWVCFDTSVISTLVDKYFGGTGVVSAVEEPRKLSPTEIRLKAYVCDAITSSLDEAWMPIRQLSSVIGHAVSRSSLSRQEDVTVVVEAQLKFNLGEEEVVIMILYPYSMLEPLSDTLRQEITTSESRDNQFSSAMRRELMNCDVELRGVMAETRMTIGKVLALKTGDFIPLRDIENVSFKANQIPLFNAQVGISNGRVSASFNYWHSET